MQITTHYSKLLRPFSGGLLGVLLFILIPGNAFAFQVDSLQQVQSLDGLAQSILKFADYDADGDLDVIIAGTNSSSTPTVKLYKNDGSANFTEDNNSTITGFNYPGLNWGDVDGDGDLDFVISGNTSSGYQAKLYLNNGSAVFTEASSDPFYDAYWGNMELGDLDNDGDLDVFQTGLQSNGQRVAEIFWNDGSGNFTIDTNNSFTGTGDGETPLADVDNDGDLDILLSGYIDAGGNITQVHLNDGTGNFTLSQSLQGVASNGMDFGDYDNDGDIDLILIGLDYSASARRANIYENDGTGNFAIDATNTIASGSSSNAKWGDYDHDGDLDLIVSGFSDASIRETYIYTNNGTGSMTYTSNGAITGSEEGYVDWADLDGDGFLEVAITGWDGSTRMTKIYQNIRTLANAVPTSPTNLQASVLGDSVSFSWNAATDTDGGPLSYALFYHNSDSSKYIIPAYSDTTNGFRRVNGFRNLGMTTTHKIAKTNIPYGSFSWGVQAIDGAGKPSAFSKSTVNIQPQTPTNLNATRNELSVDLTWTANTTDSVEYYVIYKEDNNSGQIDSIATSSTNSFSYSGLNYGNTYDFYVAAKTTAGVISDRSDSFEIVVPSLEAPLGLTFTRNELSVDLEWNSVQGISVDYYIIYKEDNNSGQIDSLAFTSDTTYSYPTLEYGNTYDFYVAIKTTSGFTSDRSDSVEFVVPTLDAPSGLTFTRNELSVDLEWNSVQGVSVDYYIIYKEDNNSGQIDSLGFSSDTSFTYAGLDYGNTYDFYVAAKTTAGVTSDRSGSIEFLVPVPVPSGLTFSRSELTVDLEWSPNQGVTIDYYIVYKEDNNSGQIDSLGFSSDTTFTFSGLSYGNTYDFYLAAKTTAGVISDRSDSVEIVVPTLSAPSGLTFTRNELSVDLEWNTVQGFSVDYYIIYRELNNSGQIDSLGFSSDTTFTFSGLSYGNTYDFYVAAKTTAGVTSDRSDSVEIVVPSLNAPNGLTFTRNELSVDLEWNTVQGVSVDYYIIYRELNNSGQIDSLGFSSDISFTYTGLDYGNNYDFYVAAKTTAGVTSDRSDSVEFVVPSLNAPQNLQFTRNKLSVDLSWQSVNNVPVDYYVIYKEEDNSGQIDSLGFSYDTTFNYAGLDYAKIYDFYVATRTTSGKLSNRSDSVEFEMPAVGVFSLEAVDSTGFQKVGTFNGITHFDFADYDLDGDFDMLAVGYDTLSGFQLKVFDNDGEGNFSNSNFSVSQIDGSDPELTSVKWVDANLDNLPDIFFNGFSGGGGNTKLYLSNGDGTFNDSNLDLINTYSKDAYLWMDFDTDGDDDLLLYGNELSGSSAIRLYINDGYGNLAVEDSTLFTTNYGVEGGDRYPTVFPPFEMFDYDNDRDKDLVALTEGTFTISIFENQGGLNFVKDNTVPFDAINAEAIEIADVNNDGYMDIMFAGNDNSENPKTQLYLNNSTGNSYSSGLIKYTGFTFPGLTDSDIKIRDLNNNNAAVEFILAGDSAGVPLTRVYSNLVEETGVFEIGKSVYFENGELLGLKDANIRILDLDNDNDLDVFINGNVLPNQSGDYTGRVYYYKNTTASNIPAIDNTVVYAPSASIVNDSLKIGDLPSYSNYSFYLYNTDLSKYFITPKANTVTGFRTIPDRAQVEYFKHDGNYDTDLELSHKFDRKNFPGGTYTLGVQGIRKESRIGGAFKTSTIKLGPLAPKNLTIQADSLNHSITLTWEQNPGSNTSKYVVYQTQDTLLTATSYDLSAKDYSSIIAGETTDTTFTIQSLPIDTTLYFYVSAFTNDLDIYPNYSELSEVDSTLIPSPPQISILSQAFTGTSLSATAWGDYDNDGDLDLVLTGTTNGGNSGAIAELYDNDGSGNLTKNTSVSSSLTGAYRSGVAFGDYDNDGFLDLVIIGYNTSGSGTTTLYHNNGDGTFSIENNTGFTNGAWASAYWGDANNDGYNDLYLSSLTDGNNRFNEIYLNDTDGTFTKAETNILGTPGGDFNYIDYDNDGDLDVIASGYTDAGFAQSKFYRNDDGTYVEIPAISNLIYASDHATMDWGDFNSDGYPDLFNSGNGLAQLLVNNGSGGFTVSNQSFAGVFQGAADWNDYDLDGDLDLMYTGNTNGSKSFLYDNNGDGTFTLNTEFNITVAEEGTVDWVDIDNDGDADLFITGNLSTGSRKAILYRNNTSSVNIAPNKPVLNSPIFSNNVVSLSWDPSTDTEGGTLDYNAFVYNVTTSKMVIEPQSDTTNGFRKVPDIGNMQRDTSRTIALPEGSYSWGVQAIDAAGQPSIFATSTFTIDFPDPVDSLRGVRVNDSYTLTWDPVTDANSYKVYFTTDTTSQSTFITSTTDTSYSGTIYPGSKFFFSIKVVDTNTSESPASSYVVLENPFNFELNTALSNQIIPVSSGGGATRHRSDIDWVDYDNDGDLDLSIIGEGVINTGILLLYNYDSSSGFTRDTDFILNDIILDHGETDWGDYDNDGDLDLLVVGFDDQASENISAVYQNNGDKTFTEIDKISNILPKFFSANANWVDIDNDGDLDIFYNGFLFGAQSFVYLNNGDSNFTNSNYTFNTRFRNTTGYRLAVTEGEIQLIDVNNDGYVDITGTGGISIGLPFTGISLNSKNNTFTDSGNTLLEVIESSLEWGDLDADGDPDLIVMGYNPIENALSTRIYLNDGLGNLSAHSDLEGYRWGDIALSDIDNDGDLDLVISGLTSANDFNTAGTKVFSNDLSGTNSFIELTGSTLPNLGRGNLDFADFDQDGDLDLIMNGRNCCGNFVQIFENTLSVSESAPSKPANASLVVKQEEVSFTWDAATDTDGGPIQYEAFLLKPDGSTVFGARSDTSNAFRRVSEMGNVGYNRKLTIDVQNLERGMYTLGVQAIDATGQVSEFYTEKVPVKSYFYPLGISGLKDTVTTVPIQTFQKHAFLKDSTITLSMNPSSNAQLFIDADNDYILDEGEVQLTNAGIDLALLKTDSLRVASDTTGFQDLVIKIETPSGMVEDSVTIQLAIFDPIATINGNADEGGWYLLSNPLNSTIGELFENIWTQGAINADSETGMPNLYFFNPDSAKYVAITTDLDTTTAEPGQGILAYIFPDDNYNDAVNPVNGGWPKSLINYGEPFKVNDPVTIKNMDVDGNGFTSGSEGFVLMGNPYGLPVSVDSLVAELVKIDPFANRYVYRWDPIEKQYNLNFTGFVNAYESFFVRTVQSGITGNAVFEYDDIHESVRLKTDEMNHQIEFDLSKGEISTGNYAIQFTENALEEIDPYDGYYLGSFASNYTNMYSTIGDQPLSLNNLPLNLSEIIEIPLFIHSTEEGQHTLEWSIRDEPESWIFELEDPSSGTIIDLSDQSTFRFEHRNQQFKTKRSHVQSPELFAFHTQKMKGISSASNFILRINPGLSTNGEDDLGIPREVELEQNYPNPFNPSSVIRFGVPEQAPVQLEVFDILGRKVMTLLNGDVKQPGRYNINFDGRSLASGMYIYRLVIGDKVLTKKMTLIK